MLNGRIEVQHIDNGLLLRYYLVENGSNVYKTIFCRDKTELLIHLSDLDLSWSEVDD